MRERLDCAVFDLGNLPERGVPPAGPHANGRLHVHHIRSARAIQGDPLALAGAHMALQRFDACLLWVDAGNLAHVRQLLGAARQHLRTPLIGLLVALKAPAIDDLYHLGMVDFLRVPCCLEELRVRIERVLAGAADAGRVCPGPVHAVAEAAARYRPAIENGGAARPSLASSMAVAAMQYATADASFAAAKGEVVAQFERAYLHASLVRSSGNITQAARAASKHRRAFWALIRKHAIDPEPYRATTAEAGYRRSVS